VSIEHMVRQVKENAWWGLRLVGVVTAPAHAHASGSATAVHASATGNGNGSANGGAHANGNGNGNGHGNGIGVRGALAMAEATETAMETVVEPRPTVFALLPDRAVTLTLEETTRFLDHTPVDELWIEGLPADESPAHRLATDAATRGISVRCLLPQDLFFGARWSVESFGEITTLTAARVPIDEFALALKRPLDFVCAALLLLVTLPVMAVSALAILCTQGTPILFRQSRIGLNGRSFRLYKFRTMYRDAEARLAGLRARNEMTGPVFKMRRDPRITPIGRWLRRLSIDELPQLFNVLKGEMSIVGPRPPTPDEVDLYEPRQRRRLSVRPGITGLWQVNGRSEISSFERWVELDLEYIDHWSLWLDLKILLRTIPAVLLARGAR